MLATGNWPWLCHTFAGNCVQAAVSRRQTQACTNAMLLCVPTCAFRCKLTTSIFSCLTLCCVARVACASMNVLCICECSSLKYALKRSVYPLHSIASLSNSLPLSHLLTLPATRCSIYTTPEFYFFLDMPRMLSLVCLRNSFTKCFREGRLPLTRQERANISALCSLLRYSQLFP